MRGGAQTMEKLAAGEPIASAVMKAENEPAPIQPQAGND